MIFPDAGPMPISAAVLGGGEGGWGQHGEVKNTGNRAGQHRDRSIGLNHFLETEK